LSVSKVVMSLRCWPGLKLPPDLSERDNLNVAATPEPARTPLAGVGLSDTASVERGHVNRARLQHHTEEQEVIDG